MQILKKPDPIADPVTHANNKTGTTWKVAERAAFWEAYGTYETTGAFGGTDVVYRRHCGPTAITNMLLTFENRAPVTAGKRMVPQRVFTRVASLGAKRHYYLNADLLGIYGGTLNVFTKSYVRRAFALYHRGEQEVRGPYPALRALMKRELDKGSLLYMELVLHPLYGNHHLLAYGYRLLRNEAGSTRLYLLCADGWNAQPRYLYAGELLLSRFYAVSP